MSKNNAISRALFNVLIVVLLVAIARPVRSEPESRAKQETESQFLRVTHDDDEPLAMETAITRYTSENKDVTVDLVAAIHVAEKSYYDELNRRFQTYDAVLYELIAPKGTRVPKGARPTSGVSYLQSGMTDMLELEFQLEQIDYSAKNLVHADISPSEFSQSMKDRGESISQVFFRMLGHAMAQQAKDPQQSNDMRVLAAFFSKNRAMELKRALAPQFEDMEGMLQVFEGPNGSTLVTVRNQRAVDVLEKQIKQGKKRIAIFYGAAHMPDMEKRVREQIGLGKKSQDWILAWDLQGEKKK